MLRLRRQAGEPLGACSLAGRSKSRARHQPASGADAAGLTGDPGGLASALAKLERYQRGAWEQILMPGQRLPEPSVLRTHPPTAERIARLQALSGAAAARLRSRSAAPGRRIETAWPTMHSAPRGRLIGFWVLISRVGRSR